MERASERQCDGESALSFGAAHETFVTVLGRRSSVGLDESISENPEFASWLLIGACNLQATVRCHRGSKVCIAGISSNPRPTLTYSFDLRKKVGGPLFNIQCVLGTAAGLQPFAKRWLVFQKIHSRFFAHGRSLSPSVTVDILPLDL